MTDFQVGDRVSVEGVVTHVFASVIGFKPNQSETGGWNFPTYCVTLVERPKRKLRVGSVWECALAGRISRFVVVGPDKLVCLNDGDANTRDDLTLDTNPELWREVPVEELERETKGCSDCQSSTCQCDGADAW